MRKLGLLIAGLSLLSGSLFADSFYVGEPGYAGSGCPAGSASVTLSPDQKTLSVLFDTFIAEAGGATLAPMKRAACSISIPVHVPKGFTVTVHKVDWRGYIMTPRGGSVNVRADYFIAGSKGPVFNQTVGSRVSAISKDYLFENDLIGLFLTNKCDGIDTNIRINASVRANSNARLDEVYGSIDSMDMENGVIFHLEPRRCNY